MTRKVSKATIKFAKFKVIKYGTKTPILSAPQLAKVIIATRKIISHADQQDADVGEGFFQVIDGFFHALLVDGIIRRAFARHVQAELQHDQVVWTQPIKCL